MSAVPINLVVDMVGSSFHRLGAGLHCLDDVVVAGAAAEVAIEPGPNGFFREIGVVAREVYRTHDHAWSAEAALQAVIVAEGFLHRVERAVGLRDAFDGDDVGPVRLYREEVAALHRLPVHVDRAGAALSGVATDVRAGEAQGIADEIN